MIITASEVEAGRQADKRKAQITRLEETGGIVPGCPSCREFYDSALPAWTWAPRHTASEHCKSGKSQHCTCDTCF